MDMILKNTFQSISPAYELIGDVTVGTRTTQVSFNDLNITADDELMLVATWIRFDACDLVIQANNSSGYYHQRLQASSTTVSASRSATSGFLTITDPYNTAFGMASIRLSNSGYFVCQGKGTLYYGTNAVRLTEMYTTSTFTASTINSIQVISTINNSIHTGSRFQLYKLVAEKVADIIVPSNTTSVDITGLNIGKDGEYYLVSDVVNPTVTNSNYAIIFNENHVETNYWHQQLYVTSNSYSATRSNQFISIYCASNNKTLCSTNIKLTNSGYGIQQNSNVSLYGGSLVEIIKRYVTTTFTASTISHIRIASYVVNGIGANSRFTLYKMK